MSKIIRVEQVPEYFSINWMLGSRCNYDCMYCDKEWHDTTSKPHSLETMKQVWQNIYNQTKHRNLPYKLGFTGGEVTANKSFIPLVTWLRDQLGDNIFLIVSTNGSASLNYYKRLSKVVDAISFSFHSEFTDEKEFFEKVKTIDSIMHRPRKSVHVSVMDEYWNKDRIELYKKFLDQNNISYSVNQIDYSHQTRTFFVQKGVQNLDQI